MGNLKKDPTAYVCKKPMAKFMWNFEKMLKVHTPTPQFYFIRIKQILVLPPIGTLPAGSIPHANNSPHGRFPM
jgi:hypothetical protein